MVLCTCFHFSLCWQQIFHIGAFATWGSGSALGILRFMIEQVNQNMSIIPDVLFQLYPFYSHACICNNLLDVEFLFVCNSCIFVLCFGLVVWVSGLG
jgi:hypothetical protein